MGILLQHLRQKYLGLSGAGRTSCAAGAMGEAAKQMHRGLAGLLPCLQLLLDDLIDLVPQVF